ncbi:MAG TPA: hemerythrin domain-containing protein [Blastocatellia bacterium]|nr:hemerythrin domain-containing protein [Blastocatellia bacterium]
MNPKNTRRAFINTSAAISAGLFLSACGGGASAQAANQRSEAGSKKDKEEGGEVTATEDLMREHGVLRRALLVYTAAADRLRANPASVPPDALQKTARLFRTFGEDYHEKKLEEAYIFPAVRKAGGPAASYPDILVTQHDRGREITDYILSVTKGAKLGAANAEPLARAMESLVLMYRNHAAREDTIVFPAWKKTLSEKELDEMGERFEEIEHQQFGEDGFDNAVRQIGEIEGMLGLTDISQFTAPPPPKAQ